MCNLGASSHRTHTLTRVGQWTSPPTLRQSHEIKPFQQAFTNEVQSWLLIPNLFSQSIHLRKCQRHCPRSYEVTFMVWDNSVGSFLSWWPKGESKDPILLEFKHYIYPTMCDLSCCQVSFVCLCHNVVYKFGGSSCLICIEKIPLELHSTSKLPWLLVIHICGQS